MFSCTVLSFFFHFSVLLGGFIFYVLLLLLISTSTNAFVLCIDIANSQYVLHQCIYIHITVKRIIYWATEKQAWWTPSKRKDKQSDHCPLDYSSNDASSDFAIKYGLLCHCSEWLVIKHCSTSSFKPLFNRACAPFISYVNTYLVIVIITIFIS